VTRRLLGILWSAEFHCLFARFVLPPLFGAACPDETDIAMFIPLQSFAKNAGLYGERVGALHIVAPTKQAADHIRSQLSVIQRSEISNPPTYGARIVSRCSINAARRFFISIVCVRFRSF